MNSQLRFPIIACLDVHEHEHHLIEYWIQKQVVSKNIFIHKDLNNFSLTTLTPHLHYVKSMQANQITTLLSTFAPVFIVLGKQSMVKYHELYRMGVMAIWSPFASNNNEVFFPSLIFPKQHGFILAYGGSSWLYNCLRQILFFAGYGLQRAPKKFDDLNLILAYAKEQNLQVPCIIYDIHQCGQNLNSFLDHYCSSKINTTQPIFCLDVTTYNASPPMTTLITQLKHYHQKRIYHPEEVIFLLLLTLYHKNFIVTNNPNSASAKLDWTTIELSHPSSSQLKYSPFAWLYEKIVDENKRGFMIKY